MPWRKVSAMDERREFVRLAMVEGANRRELCRRFGISPDVGYKWLARALDQKPPAGSWRPSPRAFPDNLPQPQYDEGEIVRTVSTTKSHVSFKGRIWTVPKAFRGERLAIRPLNTDGLYGVYFASHQIGTIDLTHPKPVSHVPEQASAMSPV